MKSPPYGESVFINCPFDDAYIPMLRALVFAVHDCGFVARCSQEMQDAGSARISRIIAIIRDCKFGIHDLSRTELDKDTGLPRFNMPLELGLFLGAKEFGEPLQRRKISLVLDRDKYRYQTFCSDIAGQDPRAHADSPSQAIEIVRNWLRTHTLRSLPCGERMAERYASFNEALPTLCAQAQLDEKTLTFVDYAALVVEWLKTNQSLTAPIKKPLRVRKKIRVSFKSETGK